MQKMWFKAKEYGWGWQPASWQGWLVLLVYLVLVIGMAVKVFGPLSGSNGVLPPNFTASVIGFVVFDMVATIMLIVTCYKTGEKPTWRWGNKNNEMKK